MSITESVIQAVTSVITRRVTQTALASGFTQLIARNGDRKLTARGSNDFKLASKP